MCYGIEPTSEVPLGLNETQQIGNKEFIGLMAVLMSITAFSIDAMLPAMSLVAEQLHVKDVNDVQMIVTALFAGLAFGLLLFGPYSDSFGRKKSIYLGLGIFLLGSLTSFLSTNLSVMLLGRFCQGFGAASCRVGTISMIRDKFSGREMGRIVSLIMIFFILVPVIAPSAGQVILSLSGWRAIFAFMGLLGGGGLCWIYFRQPETLVPEKRLKFSLPTIFSGVAETLKNPHALGYTAASGLIMGAFIGYLSTAQQLFQIKYELGNMFSLYFGILASSIGLASFTNAKLVIKWGMERLCIIALATMSSLGLVFSLFVFTTNGNPPLFSLVGYLLMTFFGSGILFGNLGSLAIQRLGHIAGVANSVISSVQTFISVLIGGIIGHLYSGSVVPLVLGFCLCSLTATAIVIATARIPQREDPVHF